MPVAATGRVHHGPLLGLLNLTDRLLGLTDRPARVLPGRLASVHQQMKHNRMENFVWYSIMTLFDTLS